MRLVVGLVVGILVGFLLGGIEPRRQLSGKDADIARLEDELEQARKKGKGRGSFLPLPDMAVVEEARRGRDADRAREAERSEDGAVRIQVGDERPPEAPGASTPEQDREEAARSFDLAVDAQRVRARQSRAALKEQAGLDDEEMAAFDDIVSQMNEDLAAYGDEVLAWADEEPETRDALGVAHEVTGILYESQSALEELVGSEAMAEVDEPSRQIWNYIDLETFRPAVEAQIDAQGGAPAPGAP